MKKRKLETFNWALLFAITGLGFLIFSGLLKLADREKVGLFFTLGFIFFATGIIWLFFPKNIFSRKETGTYLPEQDNNN